MLIGAHVSVARGYREALSYECSVGGECMQFFAKSPRQWAGPPVDAAAAVDFAESRRSSSIHAVLTHTAYLLNLSSTDEVLRERSVVALADELVRASVLAADGVVTHVGNDKGGDPAAAATRAAASICRAFELAGDRTQTRLLLENTAGAGSSFGSSVEDLARCIEHSRMPAEKLGVCIDTCHAFAFGYALDTASGCDELVSAIARHIGLERLGAMHLNDCMFERGSRRDRHAWIGDGLIGEEGFAALLQDERLEGIPGITEMPGEVPVKDKENLKRLSRLRGDSRR